MRFGVLYCLLMNRYKSRTSASSKSSRSLEGASALQPAAGATFLPYPIPSSSLTTSRYPLRKGPSDGAVLGKADRGESSAEELEQKCGASSALNVADSSAGEGEGERIDRQDSIEDLPSSNRSSNDSLHQDGEAHQLDERSSHGDFNDDDPDAKKRTSADVMVPSSSLADAFPLSSHPTSSSSSLETKQQQSRWRGGRHLRGPSTSTRNSSSSGKSSAGKIRGAAKRDGEDEGDGETEVEDEEGEVEVEEDGVGGEGSVTNDDEIDDSIEVKKIDDSIEVKKIDDSVAPSLSLSSSSSSSESSLSLSKTSIPYSQTNESYPDFHPSLICQPKRSRVSSTSLSTSSSSSWSRVAPGSADKRKRDRLSFGKDHGDIDVMASMFLKDTQTYLNQSDASFGSCVDTLEGFVRESVTDSYNIDDGNINFGAKKAAIAGTDDNNIYGSVEAGAGALNLLDNKTLPLPSAQPNDDNSFRISPRASFSTNGRTRISWQRNGCEDVGMNGQGELEKYLEDGLRNEVEVNNDYRDIYSPHRSGASAKGCSLPFSSKNINPSLSQAIKNADKLKSLHPTDNILQSVLDRLVLLYVAKDIIIHER